MWKPIISAGGTARYLAIANALEQDVRQGQLRPGDALPTHRELADALGVTVGTVTRGYQEAARRGLVRGETGRGTFVAAESGLSQLFEGRGEDVIQMGLNLPLEAFSPNLAKTLAALSRRGDLQHLLRYNSPEGLAHHREAGAAWTARHGLSVPRSNILVCAGAQHALQVAFTALFRAGDRIGVEEFTYPTVKNLARQLDLRLVPLALDRQGLIPESLHAACLKQGLSGLYMQTSCNNPTTATLTESRRHEVCELADRFDLTMVEDDSYGLTVDHGLPPLAARAPHRTAFVAGTSKMLCGGLRVAFLAAPKKWHARLRRGIMSSTWMVAPLMAEIAATWITDGTAERILEAKILEAGERNELARVELGGLRFRSKPTGHFIWVTLPDPWRGGELEQVALERGVSVTSAEHFAFGHSAQWHGVRISLSSPGSRLALRKGLRILMDILQEEPTGAMGLL